MAIARYISLAVGSLLMALGVIWSIVAVASAAWQVSSENFEQFDSSHQVNERQYCTHTAHFTATFFCYCSTLERFNYSIIF